MRYIFLLTTLLIVPLNPHAALQAQNRSLGVTRGAPALASTFRDNFETDSRDKYETLGDVSWTKGRLELQQGASINRAVGGGSWAKLSLGIDGLGEKSPDTAPDVRIWFVLKGATSCYVRFRPEAVDDRERRPTVILVNMETKEGQLTGRSVREEALARLDLRQISIEYRRGMVKVGVAGERILTAYIDKGQATVTGVAVQCEAGGFWITQIACENSSPPPELTIDQQRIAEEVQSLVAKRFKLQKQGRFAECVDVIERIIALRKRGWGEHYPSYCYDLNNLAIMNRNRGELVRAIRLFDQAEAAAARELGVDHPDYASVLANLSDAYGTVGRFRQAESLVLKALAIRKATIGENHPLYAQGLNNLAVIYDQLGDPMRSFRLLEESLRVVGETSGKRSPQYASVMCNLARRYEDIGNRDRAAARLLLAKSIYESADTFYREYPVVLAALANNYLSRGDYRQAEKYLLEAENLVREKLGATHYWYAAILNNIAVLKSRQGKEREALEIHHRALNALKRVRGDQHPDYASVLANLALHHRLLGDDREAEKLLRKVIEIRKNALGERNGQFATGLTLLGNLLWTSGELSEASAMIERAVKIHRSVLERNSAMESAHQQRRAQASRRHHLDCWINLELTRKREAVDLLEEVWRWKGAVTARQIAYRNVASDPRFAALFAELQASSRRLSLISGRAPSPPRATATDSEKEVYEQQRKEWEATFLSILKRREELERAISAGKSEFRDLTNPLSVEDVQSWLPAKCAFVDFLACVKYDDKYDGGKAVAVDERYDHYRYVVFVVRPDRDPVMIGLGSVSAIAKAIETFRTPFERGQNSPRNQELAQEAARTLRRELWAPIEAHLNDVDTVIISPDGPLGMLPFAALPGRSKGSYLLEDYRIATTPMVALLRPRSSHDAPAVQATSGLLAVGGIDYTLKRQPKRSDDEPEQPPWLRPVRRGVNRNASISWESLPESAAEVGGVRESFERKFNSDATILRQAEATESAFVREAPKHFYLHVATHAFFAAPTSNETSGSQSDSKQRVFVPRDQLWSVSQIDNFTPGLLSGLAFAGANNAAQSANENSDGILTTAEIETLDLRAVDLVVLSACETGLGRIDDGEGLIGLQRAFQVAGARSCIGSLWKVRDDVARKMMAKFYRYHWEDGLSKMDALRKAQLDVLRDAELFRSLGTQPGKVNSESRNSPAYWAAFQLSGDWR